MSGRWGDRPLGRGDGGKRNLKSARFRSYMLRSRAAGRHTGAVSTAPESATNSRLQLRFCSPPPYRSIARPSHPARYSQRHPSVLSPRYLRTFRVSGRSSRSKAESVHMVLCFLMDFQRDLMNRWNCNYPLGASFATRALRNEQESALKIGLAIIFSARCAIRLD
jgi:hypothetical protein